jgi:hypothetical protein
LGGLHGSQRDVVRADVVRVPIAAAFVVGDDHLRPNDVDQPRQFRGLLGEITGGQRPA